MNYNNPYRYLKELSPITYIFIFITSLMIVIIIAGIFSSIKGTFIFFIIMALMLILYYYHGIEIGSNINRIGKNTELDILFKTNKYKNQLSLNPTRDKKEVYHLSNNKYTYDEARGMCEAHGGRLANWREIDTAYRKGGEWCGYGWSENQMAFFPTQYKTWNILQNIKGHKNDCGRPGVNGGFISNPNIKFGANCYGKKPDIKPLDKINMDLNRIIPTPELDDTLIDGLPVADKLDGVVISPFNRKKWEM
jgi:hypothetical protein